MSRPLGQHFLFDRSILNRIASAACPGPDPELSVIEIGPGPGTLTECLLERSVRLAAVEIDADLATALRTRYSAEPRFRIIEADVLSTDLAPLCPAVVAGNLPYYITSPIVGKVLSLGPLLVRAVFLVQKEVALRLAASPGSRDYGYLSVATQVQCSVERLFLVRASAFRPPPQVDSAVVRLAPHCQPLTRDLPGFLQFASACFRHKRKTLRNNLSSLYPRALIDSLPESSLRAEQLSIPGLLQLFTRLSP